MPPGRIGDQVVKNTNRENPQNKNTTRMFQSSFGDLVSSTRRFSNFETTISIVFSCP